MKIRKWAQELGFDDCGISGIDLSEAEKALKQWLNAGYYADMEYMHRHGTKRSRPEELIPNTLSIISVRMNYFPAESREPWSVLKDSNSAYLSRYALGRDYHKVLKQRLQKLAEKIQSEIGEFGYRAFVDSAPVLETEIAQKAGLGWKGKHTLVINRQHGSWHFLGELYTDLPLEERSAASNHCGSCRACLDACPTNAIVKPYTIDASRCISYLTIENHGPIPEAFRIPMGNRIYGCDDCQLVCPWNKCASPTQVEDFLPRHSLDDIKLAELAGWTETQFLDRFQGSPIRRIGHERWLRNIAVALGNASNKSTSHAALKKLQLNPSPLVQDHVNWALRQEPVSNLG